MLPHSEEVEMKNRLIVALLLAVVLALPAFAQQTTSTTPSQPAASQPAQNSQAAPADQNAPAAAQPAQAAPADQNAPAAAQAGLNRLKPPQLTRTLPQPLKLEPAANSLCSQTPMKVSGAS